MVRSLFSGILKPASSLPFQASLSASPSVRAISPRPACSRLRFSALALVTCAEVLAPGMAENLRHGAAQRVIHARGAAGEDGDEFLGVGRGGKANRGAGRHQGAKF